jgi:hypothetical protein
MAFIPEFTLEANPTDRTTALAGARLLGDQHPAATTSDAPTQPERAPTAPTPADSDPPPARRAA